MFDSVSEAIMSLQLHGCVTLKAFRDKRESLSSSADQYVEI